MKKYYTLLLLVLSFVINAQNDRTTNDLPNKLLKPQLEAKDMRVYVSSVYHVPLYYKTLSAVYQLDSMKSDYFDDGDSTWYWDDLEVMEYNLSKMCVSEIDYDFHNGYREKDYGNFYDYDANGNFIEEIGANWNNGQWDTSWKEVFSYNAAGQYLGAIEYDYYNGVWEENWKSEYTYDANGYLIERTYFDWDNGQWEAYSKLERTNHADGRIESTLRLYHNGSNFERDDSTFFGYNSLLQLTREEGFDWAPSWRASSIRDYSYYANGDLEERISYYKSMFSSVWDTTYKYVYIYNTPTYLAERIEMDWENGIWVNYYKEMYTYDVNYVYPQITANPYYLEDDFQMYLTEFEYYWDDDDAVWELEYRDYFYWSHTGIGVAELELNEVVVYPNPSTNQLTIELKTGASFEYALYDLNGRMLREKHVDAKQTTLQLKGYAKGMYLLNITQDDVSSIHKIIIQ